MLLCCYIWIISYCVAKFKLIVPMLVCKSSVHSYWFVTFQFVSCCIYCSILNSLLFHCYILSFQLVRFWFLIFSFQSILFSLGLSMNIVREVQLLWICKKIGYCISLIFWYYACFYFDLVVRVFYSLGTYIMNLKMRFL
jgi:hypothetical protein